MLVYTCFNIGCALSKNTGSILVFPIPAGTFAAASPLTNSGGVIADLWDAKTRGIALSLFSLAPFAGPALGPIVSGFIAVSGTSWRWLFWVCTIFLGRLPRARHLYAARDYAPIILLKKARRIRKETNDERYKPPSSRLDRMEGSPQQDPPQAFHHAGQEPMLLVMTFYLSFVYGVVYLLFEAFPIVFSVGHGFNAGISGVMFRPILLGRVVRPWRSMSPNFNPKYARLADKLKEEA